MNMGTYAADVQHASHIYSNVSANTQHCNDSCHWVHEAIGYMKPCSIHGCVFLCSCACLPRLVIFLKQGKELSIYSAVAALPVPDMKDDTVLT